MPRAYTKSGSVEKYEGGLSVSVSSGSTPSISVDSNGNYSWPSISNYTYQSGASSGDLSVTTNYNGVTCKAWYKVAYYVTIVIESDGSLYNYPARYYLVTNYKCITNVIYKTIWDGSPTADSEIYDGTIGGHYEYQFECLDYKFYSGKTFLRSEYYMYDSDEEPSTSGKIVSYTIVEY